VPSGNPSRDARLGTISGKPEPAASSGGRSIQNCPICAQQHIPADPVSSTPNRQGESAPATNGKAELLISTTVSDMQVNA
jgi:hypothetical protein